MSEVRPSDILLRVGGRTLLRHGVLALGGPARGRVEEFKETFTRADAATCATYVDQDGILRTAEANRVRIEYPPALSGLVDAAGLPYCGPSLEGSRTNAFTFSEDFTNAAWTKLDAGDSVTPDAIAGPDTVVSADKMVEGTANSQHGLLRNTPTLTDNTKQPFTLFAKAAERSWFYLQSVDKANTVRRTWFNVSTGALGTTDAGHTVKITGPHNGFYRCQMIFDSASGATAPNVRWSMATGDGVVSYVGSAGSGMYFAGAQFETDKNFPSSYIKTVASTVTRAADSLTLPFNFGPMDLTVLQRVARPVYADAAGDIGLEPAIFKLSTVAGLIRGNFQQNFRQFRGFIDTPGGGTDVQQTLAIPAGSVLETVAQFRNLKTTGGLVKLDVGAGFSADSPLATAITSFGNQTLEVGMNTSAHILHGVLLDLIFVRGLHTLAECLAIP